MARLFLCGLAMATLASVALGACPNKCSGHGTCGANDICDCTQNWINSDCSGRLCPYSRAWHDTARNSDDAHYYAECGNRGTCDRSSGICQCDHDFEGSGCRRMRCPDSCSGHGRCLFVEELATLESDYRVKGDDATKYSLWEREKVQGCQCDAGWEGHNCNSRVCPKGDDPLTVMDPEHSTLAQTVMTQGIQIPVFSSGSKSFVLRYHDPYGATWTTDTISVLATDRSAEVCPKIKSALMRLPNFALNSASLAILGHGELTVVAGDLLPITRDPQDADKATVGNSVDDDGTNIVCLITFPSAPGTTGLQPLLECDSKAYDTPGSQPYSIGGATCTVDEHYVTSSPPSANSVVYVPLNELATCSNRGLCNGETGECVCYAGHTGLACELQEALV